MQTPFWLAGLCILISAYSIYRIPAKKRAYARLLSQAMDLFKRTSASARDNRFSFNGNAAEVLRVEPVGIDRSSFALTIYARNHAGEYFMFKATATQHWLKRIEPRVAKLVLKDRFVAPPESNQLQQ